MSWLFRYHAQICDQIGLLHPPWRRLCFHCCPLLCLFVCLSVSNITDNSWTDFHEIFRVGETWYKEQFNPLNPGFFPTFSEQPIPLSSIAEKQSNGFSWNFQKGTDMPQGAGWNIFGMLRLTPWILGRFIYFLDQCYIVILCRNGWTDFHDFFMKRQAWHKK